MLMSVDRTNGEHGGSLLGLLVLGAVVHADDDLIIMTTDFCV